MSAALYSRLFTFLLVATFVSCKKEADDTPPENKPGSVTSDLQNIWLMVSVRAYADRGFLHDSGYGYYSNGADIWDFRKDGKLYALSTGSLDTADYKILPDDSTMLFYQYKHGVRPSIADTLYIRSLVDKSLILAKVNPAGDWGKFTFKRN